MHMELRLNIFFPQDAALAQYVYELSIRENSNTAFIVQYNARKNSFVSSQQRGHTSKYILPGGNGL